MKNADLRHFLQREFLRQIENEKPLSKSEGDALLRHLLKLHQSNVSMALSQHGIYAAAYGDLQQFVYEFLKHVTPVVSFYNKSIANTTVLGTKTAIIFSPRLVEIALGSMLHVCLCVCNNVTIKVRTTTSHVMIRVISSGFEKNKDEINCIGKIAALHGGRFVREFSENKYAINLLLPLLPHFQPLKFIPCSPELCRICRIWNFNG